MKTLTYQERVEQELASLQVLEENAIADHNFSFEGLDLIIYKNVFSPSYFNGWRTFTPALRKRILPGTEFLEIGVGSGITSLLLAKDGVKVTATDMSPLAVDNTKCNAKNNNINLNKVLLSDVYDGFDKQYKFDAIYWNAPWMETIKHDKINDSLEYGLFDNNYSCLERWIKQSRYYLKPQGKLYIGHADFGDYKRLQTLLEENGYVYKVIASEKSVEIREVEFYLYEARLVEEQNKVFISMPFTGRKYEDIIETREYYTQLAKKYNLRVLEQFIGLEEKELFEEALYSPEYIVEKDIKLINEANVLIADLYTPSVGTSFEIAYAKQQRCIPVVGFGYTDGLTKRHPWYNTSCNKIVESIQEAFTFSNKYCRE